MNFPEETKAYLTLPMVVYFTYDVLSDVSYLPINQNYSYE